MDYMKWYTEGLKFLIALQSMAPKAIDIIQHIGDDITQLIELTRQLTGASGAEAPQLATESMPEPTEDVLMLENQLMGVVGTEGSALDFTRLRDAFKKIVDSGMAEKLLPFLMLLMSKKTGTVQL